jgi:hypothetical protein
MTPLDEIHTYYALPGAHTDPGDLAPLLADLPSDIPSLVQVVQGLLIHVFWASRYGRELSEPEKATLQVRPLREKLALMQQVDPAPLTQPARWSSARWATAGIFPCCSPPSCATRACPPGRAAASAPTSCPITSKTTGWCSTGMPNRPAG